MQSRRFLFWLIIALTIVSLWINLPQQPAFPEKVTIFGKELSLGPLANKQLTGFFPVRLGLDLQGGTELVLQADMEKIDPQDRDAALESAREVIEKRVNLFGVSESLVQSSTVGDQRRILVELPGVKDLETAVSLVGKTAQLEFYELKESTPSGEATPSAQFYPTGLTGADLKRAQVTFGTSRQSSGPQVSIEFNEQGTEKFAEITKRNVGMPLAIFLDGQPIHDSGPPVVQEEILNGAAVISGKYTIEEAKRLAVQLNAGALPVPIKILQQRTIGASLGNESVQKSLVAGGIGLITVMIYMVAFYGLYGLIANIALILYTLLILAIFRTGLFIIPPVTLTLAGIAGFILSIGMAVDANILTFERMREELRSGKKGRVVLDQGFARSWTSIRDSNISSLITATILYIFGTSVVRGFALTLAIGVLVSMFSAIVVTRTLLRLLPRFRK